MCAILDTYYNNTRIHKVKQELPTTSGVPKSNYQKNRKRTKKLFGMAA